MIGQTTNQANNPPKDGTILPPTIDVDKHELTEQELADMTPMRLAERIQQMEEAFKLLGPVEDVLNRIKCLEKWLFAGKDVLTLDEASVFLDASKSQLYKLTRTFAIPHYKPNGKTIYFSKEELVETTKKPVYKNHSHNVSQTLSYAATERLSLHLNGNLFISENDRTGAYDYNNRHQSYTVGGTAKYLLAKRASYIEGNISTTNFRSFYDYINDAKTHKTGDEVLSKDQTYTNANLKGVFKTHENNTLFTGLDYVFEGLEPTETSKMLNNEYQSVYTLAAYVQDEVKLLDAISVVAGIRYAYNEKFKSQFTPKLSLMYQYSELNVRASYAAGFRSPTLQQMYAVSESRGQITVGDPDLDPEKSNFYNLNIEYNHRLFSIAASIYQNDLKDKIEAQDIGTTPEDIENGITRRRQYRNIEKARVKGFDIGFSVRPFTGFMFGANYIYTDGRNRTEDIRLERTVRHSGNFNASWRKTWNDYTFNIAINGRYQGTRWSKTYGNAPAHQLWDINTRHSFNLKSVALEPAVGVENIFNYTDDRPYNSNYATLTPGRSFYVSLLVRFKQ
mgnify:CR=1 FL=1